MSEKQSTYRQIFELLEQAIFIHQVPDVDAAIKYVRRNSGIRNLDRKEISRIMEKVCVQYDPKKIAN